MEFGKETRTQCGHCGRYLSPEERYCPHCGTKRGEGTFSPCKNLMPCIYGPPPVERRKRCTKCGHEWSFYHMIDDENYCPKCRGRAVLIFEADY